MSKRILILDDEVHSNSLLTDVYRQAKYAENGTRIRLISMPDEVHD